jgi:hypothetical protein
VWWSWDTSYPPAALLGAGSARGDLLLLEVAAAEAAPRGRRRGQSSRNG